MSDKLTDEQLNNPAALTDEQIAAALAQTDTAKFEEILATAANG